MSYIATDLDLNSNSDLGLLVSELLELGEIIVNLNQWVDKTYRVSIGLSGVEENPELSIQYCSLLERVSLESKAALNKCSRPILDIGFESRTGSLKASYWLPADLVRRASDLGFGITITIYPVGTYWI